MTAKRIFQPTKPKVSDSIEKWQKYEADNIAWDDAVAKKDREKQAKTLMSQGDFAGAKKVLASGKGKKGGAKPKRKSI
jgi:hypothetical protein